MKLLIVSYFAAVLALSFSMAGLAAGSGDPPPGEPQLSQEETRATIAELKGKHLQMPIAGVDPQSLKGSFYELRGTGLHHAVDILAPRNTDVLAVDDGKIARLFQSKLGGTTIYQYDRSGQFIYYYAHLERYAEGLKDGDTISRGQIIGYVGTSGNAPPNTPHLHFSISKPIKANTWYPSAALDPYEVFSGLPVAGKRTPVVQPVRKDGIWI